MSQKSISACFVADMKAALPTPRPFTLLLKAIKKLLLPWLLPTLSSCLMMVPSSAIPWRRLLWPLWTGSYPKVRPLPSPILTSFFFFLFFFSLSVYLIATDCNDRRPNLSHLQGISLQGPDPYSTPIPIFFCSQANVHHLFRV